MMEGEEREGVTRRRRTKEYEQEQEHRADCLPRTVVGR
jgi:hypothetical protein